MTKTLTRKGYYAYLGLVTVARAQAKTLNELEEMIKGIIGVKEDDSMYILDAIWGTDHPNKTLEKFDIEWEESKSE